MTIFGKRIIRCRPQEEGIGNSETGMTITKRMPLALDNNTWRSKEVLWKKWLECCTAKKINPLSGLEGSLLLYRGWLFERTTVSGNSLRQYLPALRTGHTRSGRDLKLSPLVQLLVAAYQQPDYDRKALEDPDKNKERRAFPISITRKIFNRNMDADDSNVTFIRAATAILISYVFFKRGEAGSALGMENNTVTPAKSDLAVALRKAKTSVAHTLSYTRSQDFSDSVIDLVLKYDRIRRSATTQSTYYWALAGYRHTPSARTITTWMKFCLYRINVQPPAQVQWS